MDYYLTDQEKAGMERMKYECAKEEGKHEGKLEGEIETVSEQMEYKYHTIPSWLKSCTKVQLKRLKQLILQDMSLEELEKIILSL